MGAEVVYDWAPGRFYFVYAKKLPAGDIAAWVMDWATGVWTYIGSARPYAWWDARFAAGQTLVNWNTTRPDTCGRYPRTDAYFFPALGYQGSSVEIGTSFGHRDQAGDCPAQAETLENGWVHYRLGL